MCDATKYNTRASQRDLNLNNKEQSSDLASISITKRELDALIAAAIEDAARRTEALFAEKLAVMEEKLTEKDAQIRDLRTAVNDLEQYSRRSHLRIHGLDVPAGTETKTAVCNLVAKLKDGEGKTISLSPQEIDAAHPLPRRTSDSSTGRKRPAAIIVRFFARDTRDKILRARRQLKGRGMSISEDMTAQNASLLKKAQESGEYDTAWFWLGKVFARKNNTTTKVNIHNFM